MRWKKISEIEIQSILRVPREARGAPSEAEAEANANNTATVQRMENNRLFFPSLFFILFVRRLSVFVCVRVCVPLVVRIVCPDCWNFQMKI